MGMGKASTHTTEWYSLPLYTTECTHPHSLNYDKVKIQKDECTKDNKDWNINLCF